MTEVFHPTGILSGTVSVEGSKSIANRALVLSSLYDPTISLHNFPSANDALVLKRALESIKNLKHSALLRIDVEDSGTACRFLLPVLAFSEGNFEVRGTKRMSERPLLPLIHSLRKLGAVIEGESLPLVIKGRVPARKSMIKVAIDNSLSSQFASALLMILPKLGDQAELVLEGKQSSLPYLDMTIEIMREFGFDVQRSEDIVSYVSGSGPLKKQVIQIEPDLSSVAFWVGITALSKGGELKINAGNYQDYIQGDRVIFERAIENGVVNLRKEGPNLILSRGVENKDLKNVSIDFSDCPDLAIPEVIMYISLGFSLRFTGTDTLEHKESKRLTALFNLLESFQVKFIKENDAYISKGAFIFPENKIMIDPLKDHRLAMGFAMLGMQHPIRIRFPEVVSKSYPAFWDDLRKVNFELIEID